MAEFVHQPNFDSLPVGKLFTEFATPGGQAPGRIVADTDNKHALLFDVGGVWLTYAHKFKDVAAGGVITCEPEFRFEDPRWASLDVMGWDGDKRHHGFVHAGVWHGRIYVSVHNEWYEFASHAAPLASLDCGAFDDSPHVLRVVIDRNTVRVQFDDLRVEAALTKPVLLGADSLRVLARGMVQDTSPESILAFKPHGVYTIRRWSGWRLKTETVYQFWSTIIRRLKVSGEAK